MKISVFGIGYVGAVASACLVESGHEVIACDTSEVKVKCIQEGRSPIVENGLPELIAKGVKSGKLTATTDHKKAIQETDMSLICVGTPSRADGSLNLDYVVTISEQIGAVIKDKKTRHIVVNRSTVVPGTLLNVIGPAVERTSGKKHGVDFGLGNNPEFLRESTAVEDYFQPTQIVVGATDEATAKAIMSIYDGIEATRVTCEVTVAEGVKYVSNAWRANKVTFGNEMGNILKEHGVDSHKVMNIFFNDKINLGKQFLLPGFAFGGSCLPKDVRAIRASANDKGLKTPLFDSLLTANELQVNRAFSLIKQTGRKKVGLMGISFKAGTDDLRESPLLTLANMLIDNGFELSIYDPCVYEATQFEGANKKYITQDIPQIGKALVKTPEELLAKADVFVIGNGTKEFAKILEQADASAPIVDLVRLNSPVEARASYTGICW
ncbi:MAG: nucleotide sugar dehydrogenase [Alphaproteobacteria bacterium]|nr:nucleotide sugar dehydrogenase [Alphaproteobacteria bacterium]